MSFHTNQNQPVSGSKIALGAIFVIVGLILLGFNYGIIPGHLWDIFFTWQTFLVLLGLVLLFGQKSKLSGLVLIIIGGIFLIPEATGYRIHFIKIVFPLFIILIGMSILFKRNKNLGAYKKIHNGSQGFINETAIFSGSEIIFTDDVFRGGTITAIFGGYHLDLTKTQLPLGTTFLEITAIFGGVEIVVPETWKVTSKATSVFGAFEDKRYNKLVDNKERELVITGTAVFGGGELKAH